MLNKLAPQANGLPPADEKKSGQQIQALQAKNIRESIIRSISRGVVNTNQICFSGLVFNTCLTSKLYIGEDKTPIDASMPGP